MREFAFAATLLMVTAGAGLADGPAPAKAEPAVAAAAAAANWTGAYAGLSATRIVGADASAFYDGVPGNSASADTGNQTGAFLGYNWQRGTLVYGAEAAIQRGDVPLIGYPNSRFEKFFDLKGRVGMASGKALFYGTAGYSTGTLNDAEAYLFDLKGMNYGVGVEYMAANRLTVGLEYLVRDMDGTTPTEPLVTLETETRSLSLRAALRF
jgi:outer membrane immunogenic protein